MKVRTEVEIYCAEEGCNTVAWSLTTFNLNEKHDVRSSPGYAEIVEEYTTEHGVPEGWGIKIRTIEARKGYHSGWDEELIVCPLHTPVY
jgi:hypothetical protein